MRVLIRLTEPTVVLSEFLGQHPIKKWYINWRLDKLSFCLIRTNSSLKYKRRITAGSCPGNELVWTD